MMINRDSGRLRTMEKLCSDTGVNTILIVLQNGEDAYFSSETSAFTAVENLLFEMAKTKDSSEKSTVYINTTIRPIELLDLEQLIAAGVMRVVTNDKVGEGLRESAKDLSIIIESEKDAILDGQTGYLCDGNDLNVLYEVMFKCLKNNHYKNLGVNALNFSKKFNWNIIVKKYIELI